MLAIDDKTRAEEKRAYDANRMLRIRVAGSDIGDIPKVKNPIRKNRCRRDLFRFLTTYFPNSTGLSPFSDDHRRVIAKMQECVLAGGRHLNAVYRGFAKTTISENTALWATLYGHRRFLPVFGADSASAQGIIDSIKLELSENDLLYEDFPEVCHAVRHLEGRAQRAIAQSYQGKLTHTEWKAERLILPTIPGSKASGAIICARGITGGFRGLKVKLPDGTQQRPDCVILDDIQTDESAGSALQVAKILSTLRKAIVKLGGHRKALAMVCNATVIEQDDVIDLLLRDATWQSERIPLVRAWPEAHKTLWLDSYATLRKSYDKGKAGDQGRAWREATAFYEANQAAMDAGAVVSWQNCYDPETETSALQHAYNALIDDGEEAFASEYQVNPLPRVAVQADDLKAEEVAQRLNRCPRGMVPPDATRLTAFIDVQQDLLFWLVAGWSEGFGGSVVDYGAWPGQSRSYFTLTEARPTISAATGIATLEGSLYAALTRLADQLLGREWPLAEGGGMRVEKCLVDEGWGASTEVVRRFCRQSAHASVLQPSKGYGVTAAMVPMSDWPKKAGERRGLNWVMRAPDGGRGRLVLFDTNGWKPFVTHRLKQPMGEPGAITLFGDDPHVHRMFADHLTSEYRVETTGRGRTLFEWKRLPNRENHLLDCMVGAAVAASILGVTPGGVPREAVPRRRVPFAEMQRRAMEGRR